MNAAQCIVRAILESDEDLMAELGEIATNPVMGEIRYALARGQEYVRRVIDRSEPGTFTLEISIKPIGGTSEWALKKGSRMVTIRWLHHSHWGRDNQGGGYFFVRPEQFNPFLRELEELIKYCSRPLASDELVRGAYNSVIRYRYSAPRKPHARQKYTENGLYAYMR